MPLMTPGAAREFAARWLPYSVDMTAVRILATTLFLAIMFGMNQIAHAVMDLGFFPWLALMVGIFGVGIKIENHDREIDGRPPYSWYDAGRDVRESVPVVRFWAVHYARGVLMMMAKRQSALRAGEYRRPNLEHQRSLTEAAGFVIDHVIADHGVSGISTTLRERRARQESDYIAAIPAHFARHDGPTSSGALSLPA